MTASETAPARDDDVLALLTGGTVELIARIMPSSNLALLVEVGTPAVKLRAVYKPQRGERELWDFEPGLHNREAAAYRLSNWLGWDLVPPTVVREDAPVGVGSVQLFIESDPDEHYFTLSRLAPETVEELQTMALFDLVVNNADRKSGHVLRGTDGRIRGIDHGLCFAAEDKLRTVIWDFAGEPIPEARLDALVPLLAEVPPSVTELLRPAEVEALQARVARILRIGIFPADRSGRRVPWPLV